MMNADVIELFKAEYLIILPAMFAVSSSIYALYLIWKIEKLKDKLVINRELRNEISRLELKRAVIIIENKDSEAEVMGALQTIYALGNKQLVEKIDQICLLKWKDNPRIRAEASAIATKLSQ